MLTGAISLRSVALSGHFLDRLRGMETLRLFNRGEAEINNIRDASQDFRQRTMEVLRPAFLSSGVLEFFTSLSIALVAVYFGFFPTSASSTSATTASASR